MKLIKLTLPILIVLFSFSANAETFWSAPLTIERLDVYYINSNRNNVMQVKSKEPIRRENGSAITTGCAPTDIERLVSQWSPHSTWNLSEATWYSALLNAYNLDIPVQIYLDAGRCSSTVGINIRGVRFAR